MAKKKGGKTAVDEAQAPFAPIPLMLRHHERQKYGVIRASTIDVALCWRKTAERPFRIEPPGSMDEKVSVLPVQPGRRRSSVLAVDRSRPRSQGNVLPARSAEQI